MSTRIVSLDILRGISASAVAIPHFFLYFGHGGVVTEAVSAVAVEIFFVLSGFVLAPQILFVARGGARFGLGTFLVRRWMRTVPPYLMVLLFVSVMFQALGSADFWRYALYVQNLFGQHLSNDYYPVAWSLSVEEWFYLCFPVFLLGLCAGKVPSVRQVMMIALAFVALVSAARLLFGDSGAWGAGIRRVVAFRMDAIAWGFVLYLAIGNEVGRRRVPWLAAGTAILGIAAVVLVALAETSVAAQVLFPFAASGFGAAAIGLCLGLETAARSWSRLGDVSGKTSYAVYLFHLLPIYLLAMFAPGWPLVLKFAVFLAGTGALAGVSSYLIEAPILAMRPRYRRRRPHAAEADAPPFTAAT